MTTVPSGGERIVHLDYCTNANNSYEDGEKHKSKNGLKYPHNLLSHQCFTLKLSALKRLKVMYVNSHVPLSDGAPSSGDPKKPEWFYSLGLYWDLLFASQHL